MEIFEVFQPLPELLVQLPHRFYQLSWPELSILSLLRPLIACIAIYLAIFLKSSSTANFPGPRPWPIVGNLPSLYRCHAERQFFLWSKQLGDVIQVRFGNMTVIVVNSAASAKEIFTGSAAALSSRPIFHTFHQVSQYPQSCANVVCHTHSYYLYQLNSIEETANKTSSSLLELWDRPSAPQSTAML